MRVISNPSIDYKMPSQFSKILVTGVAGFIGFHLSKRLCEDGFNVIGVDNVNEYYDVNLKKDRINLLLQNDHFNFHKIDLNDDGLKDIFEERTMTSSSPWSFIKSRRR